jgi:streptogramin lyase
MKIEDRVRESFRDHVQSVRASDEAWSRVRQRLARPARRRPPSRLAAAMAALVVFGLGLAGVLFAFRGGSSPAPNTARGSRNSAAVTPVIDGSVVDSTNWGDTLWLLTCTSGCGSSDAPDASSGEVVAIDASSGTTIWTSPVSSPQAIVADEHGVWVTTFLPGTVSRLNPSTGAVELTAGLSLSSPVAPGDDAFLASDIAVGDGAVWVSTARGQLDRIDPATGRVVATIALPAETTGGVAAGAGGVWVAENVDGVYRIDPATNRVIDKISIPHGANRVAPEDVSIADGHVFATGALTELITDETGLPDYQSTGTNAVATIDPRTDRVAGILLVRRGWQFRVGDGTAWLTSDQRFLRLDFTAASVSEAKSQRAQAQIVAIAAGDVWSVDRDRHLVHGRP